uniref:Uncharacterized protein n=1 Tax=Brassica oleracea var. oleracea TaxID=109376 RepID=A0A0D2ZVG4_BRAOL
MFKRGKRQRTSMRDAETGSITKYHIIATIVRGMKRQVSNIRSHVVGCTRVEQPCRSVTLHHSNIRSWIPVLHL